MYSPRGPAPPAARVMPNARLSRRLASNTSASCGTSVEMVARLLQPEADLAVDLVVAMRGLVQAGEQAQQRALARAARRRPARCARRDAGSADASSTLPSSSWPRGGVGVGQRRGTSTSRAELTGHVVRRRGRCASARPDRIGARVIGAHAGKPLEIGGHRADHAARLLRVLVDHEQAAEQHRHAGRGALALREPGVGPDQRPCEACATAGRPRTTCPR